MPKFNDFDLDIQTTDINEQRALNNSVKPSECGNCCTLNPACYASRGPVRCTTSRPEWCEIY